MFPTLRYPVLGREGVLRKWECQVLAARTEMTSCEELMLTHSSRVGPPPIEAELGQCVGRGMGGGVLEDCDLQPLGPPALEMLF